MGLRHGNAPSVSGDDVRFPRALLFVLLIASVPAWGQGSISGNAGTGIGGNPTGGGGSVTVPTTTLVKTTSPNTFSQVTAIDGIPLGQTTPEPVGATSLNFTDTTGLKQGGTTFLNFLGGAGDGTLVSIGKGAGAPLSTNDINTVAIGVGALGAITIVNSEDVAVGWGAMRSALTNTFSTAVGLNSQGLTTADTANTTFGNDSMRNSTGSNNVVVANAGLRDGTHNRDTVLGAAALAVNGLTSSVTNDVVAIGAGAMGGAGITTLSNDIAIGSSALSAATTATSGVYIGYQSGFATTTGNSNVAVGASSLHFSTTGANDVALGSSAMLGVNGNSAPTFSVAIGDSAMSGVTSASQYIAIGHTAGQAVTSGQKGVLIGTVAGSLLTTGNQNVVIGPNVGSTTLVSGSTNILIGNSSAVDTPAANTANRLNIGNAIIADMARPGFTGNGTGAATLTTGCGQTSAGFCIGVGTGSPGSTGTVAFANAAPNGWNCQAVDITNPAASNTVSTPLSTTQVTLTNYSRTTGIATAWAASDQLNLWCNAQ